jgi:methionyl-tRNA formyltransferase
MRTVIVGNRKLARHLLRQTLAEGWNVVGALVPAGELAATQANFVPVSELVADTACQLHETEDINSTETVEWLDAVDPDLCLCGGWSQIIEEAVLDVPDRGFLGFHSSRLPEGRGGAPVNWSLIDGADEVWISLFYYEQGVDSGDVLAQGSVPVEQRDDIETVFDALATEACRLTAAVRSDLEAETATAEPQSLSAATYRPRRQPQDGIIDWHRAPDAQYDWIRAQTDPYPGAYSFYQGTKLTVWEAEPVEVPVEAAAPGEVLDIVPGEGIDVRTGSGAIRLTRLKPDDRVSQWADRYAAEAELAAGDRLGRQHAPDEWLYTGIRGPEVPTTFDTNLTVGERGRLTVVSFAGSAADLTVSVTYDGEEIFESTVTVADDYRETVAYQPAETGTHTVAVRFAVGGERVDTRYLKVFVQD